jgi:hypothetical protein
MRIDQGEVWKKGKEGGKLMTSVAIGEEGGRCDEMKVVCTVLAGQSRAMYAGVLYKGRRFRARALVLMGIMGVSVIKQQPFFCGENGRRRVRKGRYFAAEVLMPCATFLFQWRGRVAAYR